MATRSISLQDFLASYRALLKELVLIAAGSHPVYWAIYLYVNQFAAPAALHVVQGESQWRARFEALIEAAGDSLQKWALPTLDVLRDVLAAEGLRLTWTRSYPYQQQQQQQQQQ